MYKTKIEVITADILFIMHINTTKAYRFNQLKYNFQINNFNEYLTKTLYYFYPSNYPYS